MSETFETVIKNYSGLSSETKPTIAAGNNVPNGSRWREIGEDGKITKIYYFNLADDKWYKSADSVKINVDDPNLLDMNSFLSDILKELKIINIHLSIMSDNEIKHTEVS